MSKQSRKLLSNIVIGVIIVVFIILYIAGSHGVCPAGQHDTGNVSNDSCEPNVTP